MKLNPDCIRQILLAVEDQTGFDKPTHAFDVAEKCEFPLEEVLYHINQCELSGFFTEVRHYTNGDDDCMIIDLSPKGHEFVNNIRSEPIWKKILKKAEPLSSSLSMTVLSEVVRAVVRAELGL